MNALPPLKVAVAQIETILGDLAQARMKHLEFIASARRTGAALLLFPELSLVGHGAGADAPRLALRRDSPLLGELAEAAGEMAAIVGFVEEAPGAVFYNAAAVLRQGRVEFVHRKLALATYGRLDDGKFFGAGRLVDIFAAAPDWRAAILICNDVWNPPLVYLAAAQGATLLLVPVSSAVEAVGGEFDNPAGWDLASRFHALTYGMPLLLANRVGSEGDLRFWGGSRILHAAGRVVAAAMGETEQLVTAELDYADVRQARWLLPTVRDADLPLIRDEAHRICRANRSS